MADHLGALLGRAPLGRAVLRRPSRRTADWLTTTTPSAWFDEHLPIGRVYVPTSSYVEMGEWALPPTRAVAFTDALHAAQKGHRPEARWLRGAFWRNFQVRYREINDLHKQMLRTSDKVDAMPDGPDRDARPRPPLPGPVERLLLARPVRRDLHQPHAAGDVRASHRRRGPRRSRARGRSRLPRSSTSTSTARWTCAWPGPGQVVSLDLDEGAGIGGWDIRAVRHALASVMRRRPEAYHETLRRHEAAGAGGEARGWSAGIHPRHRARQGAGPLCAPALRPVRAPLGPRPVPRRRPRPRRPGRPADRSSSATRSSRPTSS